MRDPAEEKKVFWRVIGAGAHYFSVVFLAGVVLGTVRIVLVAPRIGALAAVCIELPLMLTLSWLAAGVTLRTWKVVRSRNALWIGGLAFALLMLAETALALWVFGRGLDRQLAGYRTPEGVVGLTGQLVFALIPALKTPGIGKSWLRG